MLDEDLRITINHYYRLVSIEIDSVAKKLSVKLPFETVMLFEIAGGAVRTKVLMFRQPIILCILPLILGLITLMLLAVWLIQPQQLAVIVGMVFLLPGIVFIRHASSTLMARDGARSVIRNHWLENMK